MKFRYLELFWQKKNQFWPIFHCKSAFFAKSAIMTSLWRHTFLYFFGMYGKKRPIPIPWYQISTPQAFIFFQIHRELQQPSPWLDMWQNKTKTNKQTNSLLRRGLKKIGKETQKYIWILVGQAVFKLWIKTVKILFWSISHEPINDWLTEILILFWVPWISYHKIFFKKSVDYFEIEHKTCFLGLGVQFLLKEIVALTD